MNPVLSVECNEPEGIVERKVYPLEFNPKEFQLFWEQVKKFPTLYGREVKELKDFFDMFVVEVNGKLQLNGLFWRIDDFVGVYYMTEITETEANVHYSFFDARHKGREKLTKKMLKYIFKTFDLQRINVEIPMFSSKYTRHFIGNLGFTLEGIKRKAAYFNGEWFNVAIYGLLKEEVINGSTES